jgi:hypothetical protein
LVVHRDGRNAHKTLVESPSTPTKINTKLYKTPEPFEYGDIPSDLNSFQQPTEALRRCLLHFWIYYLQWYFAAGSRKRLLPAVEDGKGGVVDGDLDAGADEVGELLLETPVETDGV